MFIAGRVQGVGFRYFARRSAELTGVRGWASNRADGSVEVHAEGDAKALEDFEARLRVGPRMAEVRSVEVQDDAVLDLSSFDIR
jgi:acylphosphatase